MTDKLTDCGHEWRECHLNGIPNKLADKMWIVWSQFVLRFSFDGPQMPDSMVLESDQRENCILTYHSSKKETSNADKW